MHQTFSRAMLSAVLAAAAAGAMSAPVTQAFGIDLTQDAEDVEQPAEPASDGVTAMLEDYARLRDKEDRAREAKAADMRRYRANVRARRTPTPNSE